MKTKHFNIFMTIAIAIIIALTTTSWISTERVLKQVNASMHNWHGWPGEVCVSGADCCPGLICLRINPNDVLGICVVCPDGDGSWDCTGFGGGGGNSGWVRCWHNLIPSGNQNLLQYKLDCLSCKILVPATNWSEENSSFCWRD